MTVSASFMTKLCCSRHVSACLRHAASSDGRQADRTASGVRTTFESSPPPFCLQLWRACRTPPPAHACHNGVRRRAQHSDTRSRRQDCTCAWNEARSASAVAAGMSCALKYAGRVAATCMASCVANCASSLRAAPDTCAPSAAAAQRCAVLQRAHRANARTMHPQRNKAADAACRTRGAGVRIRADDAVVAREPACRHAQRVRPHEARGVAPAHQKPRRNLMFSRTSAASAVIASGTVAPSSRRSDCVRSAA